MAWVSAGRMLPRADNTAGNNEGVASLMVLGWVRPQREGQLSKSKKISHEDSKAPIVQIPKEGGEGTPLVLIEAIIHPSDLVIDGAGKDDMLLCLGLL